MSSWCLTCVRVSKSPVDPSGLYSHTDEVSRLAWYSHVFMNYFRSALLLSSI
ncbi:hypothetical protein CY34DRAFT_811812, partial [Suillus luteus UH-Slu-Lm8-n1]